MKGNNANVFNKWLVEAWNDTINENEAKQDYQQAVAEECMDGLRELVNQPVGELNAASILVLAERLKTAVDEKVALEKRHIQFVACRKALLEG